MKDFEARLPGELKAFAKQSQEFRLKAAEEHELVEKLLQLLVEKEKTNEKLRFDLDDQFESRRLWQKRATDVESRITSAQQILVLIDGNQHFFKHDLIRAGTSGARDAVRALIEEAKEFAAQQHKNDLPDNISVVVHIFSDIGRLARDLSDANLLPELDQLWTFIQDICKTEPCLTVSDCGAGHEAVDAKLKQFYELHIENCHCRHLFLALGHESEYYKILQLYSDDECTKGKTSLTRPANGFPSGFNSPFHTVEFSALESIPSGAGFGSHVFQNISGQAWDAEDTNHTREDHAYGPIPVPNIVSTAATQDTNAFSSNPNIEMEIPSTEQQLPSSAIEPENIGHVYDDTNSKANHLEDPSGAGVVKLQGSNHSSSKSDKAVEQSWETSTTGNVYVPAPIQGPWGEEDTTLNGKGSYQQQSHDTNIWRNQAASPSPTYPQGESNGVIEQSQRPARRNDRWSSDHSPRTSRRIPRQFEGSWDDMIQDEQKLARTHVSSPLPTPASAPPPTPKQVPKSNGFLASPFIRKVPTEPDPNPNQRPIRSPIALNKLDERIDLVLPRPTKEDQELFNRRTKTRRLCNEHHLRSKCNNPRCPHDHEEITDGMYLVLRHMARKAACSIGPDCRRHDCFASHHCSNVSNVSSCARPNCPFRSRRMHEITDFEVVRKIEPPASEEA
ncbi:uncharacterized protein Z518_06501 [Rhinocladiella mackenziei CBS 650.93]|uniref:Rhinocladiella mackenziei CBS 650.93 unplaced genomic scaffold supercont1.5, whole genome shotgun sequence n=1 Tax=Rhinocladiella mackenziei CBS 650.93 TaxID=1442369 RepID=A0A0D2II58_9EURO|nr:uncharacterized protein Z518_06501 [Rhinocladiella mackenziei CBS 650.93]KIX02951.1 hypothetical protein Z518_06501 [Rhinocladiella mackenziei CBS 650.93]